MFSAFSASDQSGQGTTNLTASAVIGNIHLPNLPPEEKLSYIDAQKRKLMEYIKFLDSTAAQQRDDDTQPASTINNSLGAVFASTSVPSAESRRKSMGSPLVADDGFESVDPQDLVSAYASGMSRGEVPAQRTWYGWVTGAKPSGVSPTSELSSPK
jgi:hypothetical protein